MDTNALQVGGRLGPYEIVGVLEAGGMGEVWKARDTRLGRLVAIKRLMPGYADRFEREARAIAALNHPNICQIHDIGPDYLVLEYVDGVPLRGPVPPPDARRWALQLASALEAAHRSGIIHRDLKPANVLVTADGTLKVLDFGVAKLVETDPEITRTGDHTVVGTAAYMAPEQAEGRTVDARADIFSLGAVLYEVLCGQRAFPGSSTIQVLTAVLRDTPAPLERASGLGHVARRCLEKDPKRRYQTMAEVRAALEQVGTGPVDVVPVPTVREPSIAVLPFANLSADKDDEYFSDGLAAEILNELTRVAGLKVIARTSAFAFKGKRKDIRRIAELLDVTNVLEGTVRKSGNRIRVTTQLIDAADGTHLWADRYDRELADVFDIQDQIARAIVDALKLTLAQPAAPAYQPSTASLAARDAVMKADFHARKETPEGLQRSRQLLEEATSLYPDFALAHARLGRHFFMLYVVQAMPAHEAVPLVRQHVERALVLDPALAEAHSVMGCLAALYDFDWAEADRRFRIAASQSSVPALVRVERSNFFWAHAGRGNEAVEDLERARVEDPLNPFTVWTLAVSLRAAGRDEEADARYREVVEMDVGRGSTIAAIVLSGNYVAEGAVPEALKFAEAAYARAPGLPASIGQLAGMLARTGDASRSQELVEHLLPGTAFGTPFGLALRYLATSDLDEAANWLEKAIEQRDLWVSFLLNVGNIGGRVMRSSPRGPALLKLLNLP